MDLLQPVYQATRDLDKRLEAIKGFSDCSIVCEGQTFNVHQAILCQHSPVLKAALTGRFQEGETGIVEIGFDILTVIRFIQFMYTGTYDIDPHPAIQILMTNHFSPAAMVVWEQYWMYDSDDDHDASRFTRHGYGSWETLDSINPFKDDLESDIEADYYLDLDIDLASAGDLFDPNRISPFNDDGSPHDHNMPYLTRNYRVTKKSRELIIHCHMNSIADYYNVSTLATLAITNSEKVMNEWYAKAFYNLLLVSRGIPNDRAYRHMLIHRAARNVRDLDSLKVFDRGGIGETLLHLILDCLASDLSNHLSTNVIADVLSVFEIHERLTSPIDQESIRQDELREHFKAWWGESPPHLTS